MPVSLLIGPELSICKHVCCPHPIAEKAEPVDSRALLCSLPSIRRHNNMQPAGAAAVPLTAAFSPRIRK